MARYLLVTRSDITVVEEDPDEIWRLLIDLKYPNGFISLTVMEDVGGPY